VPRSPLPRELEAFLSEPNPAVIATLRGDGRPHTAATWYLWERGRVLVNMDERRERLQHVRRDPRVSITVLGADGWHRHVTLEGSVVSLNPDREFEGIDRLARHYTGAPFGTRDHGRVNAWIEIVSWHAWAGTSQVGGGGVALRARRR
jgi:PPOX class probable F420-dependent enzyme